MAVFTDLTGATVVLISGGVFRQTGVATYDGRYFAKFGGGYVALHREGGTSAPRVSWEALEGVNPHHRIGKSSLFKDKA